MWLSCSSFFQQFFHCYCPVKFGRKADPNGDFIKYVLFQCHQYIVSHFFNIRIVPIMKICLIPLIMTCIQEIPTSAQEFPFAIHTWAMERTWISPTGSKVHHRERLSAPDGQSCYCVSYQYGTNETGVSAADSISGNRYVWLIYVLTYSTINRMCCLKVLLRRLTHHRNHHSLTVAKISNVNPKKSAMLVEMEKFDIQRPLCFASKKSRLLF